MSTGANGCEYSEVLREYALGELSRSAGEEIESHLATCEACSDEWSTLQFTLAALRSDGDHEIPQRIAFVSDKVLAPSGFRRFFDAVWNSGPKLAFLSASILAGAIVFSSMHRAPIMLQPALVQTASVSRADLETAVRQAVVKVREEDAKNTKLLLAAVEKKYGEKQRALLLSVDENFQVMQKRLSSYTMLASSDASRSGGQ